MKLDNFHKVGIIIQGMTYIFFILINFGNMRQMRTLRINKFN